jgi:hypothetical protein
MFIGSTVPRAAAHLASALVLAFVAAGCGAPDTGDGVRGEESVVCPAKIAPWAVGTHYNVGDLVTFDGAVFQCRQAHTPVDGWFPNIVPALWNPVQCAGGNPAQQPPTQQPPAQQPPAQQPPAQQPPVQTPPPPANNGQCQANGAPGPHFDPAGAKNVGNGHGGQFIGGQCLSHADCASGCCALPCGICSGPGAQFQAGKQGCGFGG